jgi:hypothetical protein
MTFTTCNKCGAIARILAGGISHLDRNCVSDLYRCDECHTVTWQDRVYPSGRNFFNQAIDNGTPVYSHHEERALLNV